jgi:hypothetical protein
MIKPGQLIMPRGSGSSRIVAPGFLSSLTPITRAQASVVTTGTTPSGGIVTYGANQPRFRGPAQSLILESQRTNAITNPRGLGVIAGTPGTMPTTWYWDNDAGLTRQIVGSGVENGIHYVEIRVTGTSTSTLPVRLACDNTANAPALTNGQSFAMSAYISHVAGNFPSTGIMLTLDQLGSNRASLSAWRGGPNITPTATLTRYTAVVTANNASCAFGWFTVWLQGAANTTYDFTFRVGMAQAEANVTSVSSLILPPEGSTGASTRASDVISVQTSHLFPQGVGTIIGRTTVDASREIASIFTQVDDNTLNNRISMALEANSTTYRLYSIRLGSSSFSTLGNVPHGQPFNWGFTFDGSSVVGSLNGGAAVSPSLHPLGSMSHLRVNGIAANGSNAIFGAMHYQEALPFVVSPDQLRSLVANIPT